MTQQCDCECGKRLCPEAQRLWSKTQHLPFWSDEWRQARNEYDAHVPWGKTGKAGQLDLLPLGKVRT